MQPKPSPSLAPRFFHEYTRVTCAYHVIQPVDGRERTHQSAVLQLQRICLRNGWACGRFEWPPSTAGNVVDEEVVVAMANRTPSNSFSGEAKDGTGT